MSNKWQRTICRVCNNGCGMLVNVENGIAKQINGDPEDPRTEGNLCVKGRSALSLVYSPDRLKRPLARVGKKGDGKWETISWEEALERITYELQSVRDKYGAKSIGLYRGQASDWGAPMQYARRFMNVLGSPNIFTPAHLCARPAALAKTVTYGGVMEIPDWENTKCIVLWGANPSETNRNAVRGKKIMDAIKRGAKLIVIDPFNTYFAKKADYWLQIKPGTDCALALSMINVIINDDLFDNNFVRDWTVGFTNLCEHISQYSPEDVSKIVDISPDIIRTVARLYATHKPGIIHEDNGLHQRVNVVGTIQALCILESIVGNIDTRGSRLFPSTVKTQIITLSDDYPVNVDPVGFYPLFFRRGREVPASSLLDAIMDEKPYPIKALLVQGGNPVVTLANTARTVDAFKKLDFLVVMDLFLNRTAKFADIVLPASTYMETTGLNHFPSLTTNYLRLQQQVIEPMYESWPDWKFWFKLGKVMGFEKEFPWESVEEAIDEQLKPSGYTEETLKNRSILFPLEEKKYQINGFNTPSGKVELYSSTLEKFNYDPLPIYKDLSARLKIKQNQENVFPLIGTSSPKTQVYIHTALRNIPNLRRLEPEPFVMINPKDAENRGIKDRSFVAILSAVGCIKMRACITDETRPGVIGIPWGWGEAIESANMNDLIDDSVRDPICGATPNREFLCDVQPCN